MTHNSPLDEHIKEKFGNYSPDVPPHIWENIIAETEKRRPVGFWFRFLNKKLLLLLFGIVLSGTGIILYKKVYPPAVNNANRLIEPIKANNTENNIPGENKKTSNNNGNTIQAENNIEKDKGTQNIISSTEKDTRVINITSTENTSRATKKTKSGSSTKIDLQVSTGIGIKNNTSVSSTESNSTKVQVNRKQKYRKESANIVYQNPEAITDDVTESGSDVFFLNRLLLNPGLIRFENNFKPVIKKTNNPDFNIPCPEAEKNAAGNKRYFEIYGGPDYAFRSITDTGNSAYLQKRKESTGFSSAFSVGARYTRVFSNGMSFRTGINYSQINEKFKYAEGNIIQVVYITNSNGDTTGSFTTTGTRYKTTFNKFRTIDIPLLIGYELGNGRIHANFNAGAIINVYSWQKGDVLDTAYQPVSITTGKTSSPYQFKTNAGIGFMGAVSVYYKLNDKWHIFAEPYFRYNFSPASKADLTLKQKYNTAGIRLGLRIDF
jgi:hypothetical protein